MRILICNDDGIYAPGIAALAEAMRPLGEIRVVAPEAEQSAVGHAITIASPLKAKPVHKHGEFFGHAVSGTPADCVKLAISELLDEPPDLVVSGINLGPNAGISVLYSGTVSGATEGAILGVPSIALSLGTFHDPIWETGARVARHIVERFSELDLPNACVLNVNIPNLPYPEIRGFKTVPIAPSRYVEEFDARTDPRGNAYFWMDGMLTLTGDDRENDVGQMRDGYVTLTPLHFDLTHYAVMDRLRAWDLG
jgi:5'-nucleotidase